jgi:hypothetical protein
MTVSFSDFWRVTEPPYQDAESDGTNQEKKMILQRFNAIMHF